jgi:hypothetical protein
MTASTSASCAIARLGITVTDSAGEAAMMGLQETPARLFYDFCLDEHFSSGHMLRGIDRHIDLTGPIRL